MLHTETPSLANSLTKRAGSAFSLVFKYLTFRSFTVVQHRRGHCLSGRRNQGTNRFRQTTGVHYDSIFKPSARSHSTPFHCDGRMPLGARPFPHSRLSQPKLTIAEPGALSVDIKNAAHGRRRFQLVQALIRTLRAFPYHP